MQNTDITIRQRDTYKQSYTQTNKRTERHKYIQGNIHTYIQTESERQTHRETYIQTDIHT